MRIPTTLDAPILENVLFFRFEERDIMPFSLDLPKRLRVKGWKVKIQEKERLEPPRVTVWHGEEVWRIGLRDRRFLVPPGGGWKDIDQEVRTLIEDEDHWEQLRNAWDQRYPSNPVSSTEGNDHD